MGKVGTWGRGLKIRQLRAGGGFGRMMAGDGDGSIIPKRGGD